MLKRVAVLVAACCLVGSALAACSTSSDGRPQVVVGFYPLEFVTKAIAGKLVDVTDLASPGVEPHDLELTVRQTALLSGADLVVYEKGLAPALDKSVENNRPKRVLNTVDVVPLQPPAAGEEAANGESMDEGDPHFWQDPTLLAKVAAAVTTQLTTMLPDDATTLRVNNDRLQHELTALDTAYRTGLKDCRTRTLVVSHDAFEYLGRRYDLRIEPIAGLSPDAEPSARHIAQLSDLVKTDHITTVFSERLASPKLAQALATNAGVRTGVLDPIEGLDSNDSKATYLTLMRTNLQEIREANGCR